MDFSKFLKSRTIWGGVVLVATVMFGQDVGSAVNGVVEAVSSGSVVAITTTVGALLVAYGRARAQGPLIS